MKLHQVALITILFASPAVGQNLVEIGPATTLQELLYSPSFPVPTVKVEARGCYEYLVQVTGLKNAPYTGDETQDDEGNNLRRACYTANVPTSEFGAFVFDLTQNLGSDDLYRFELFAESTDAGRTYQYWAADIDGYSFAINYLPYAEGVLVYVDVKSAP